MPKVVVARKLYDSNPELVEALRLDFLAYKSSMHDTTPVVPDHFGRDAPFHSPPSAVSSELYHLHINDIELGMPDSSTDSTSWGSGTDQYYRTSDCFLIYTIGESCRETYILLAIITPRAHRQIRDRNLMDGLVLMAEAAKRHY